MFVDILYKMKRVSFFIVLTSFVLSACGANSTAEISPTPTLTPPAIIHPTVTASVIPTVRVSVSPSATSFVTSTDTPQTYIFILPTRFTHKHKWPYLYKIYLFYFCLYEDNLSYMCVILFSKV